MAFLSLPPLVVAILDDNISRVGEADMECFVCRAPALILLFGTMLSSPVEAQRIEFHAVVPIVPIPNPSVQIPDPSFYEPSVPIPAPSSGNTLIVIPSPVPQNGPISLPPPQAGHQSAIPTPDPRCSSLTNQQRVKTPGC